MGNFPNRFGKGAGLESSSAEKTQQGYLRLENVDLSSSDVVRKRPGASEIVLTTSVSATDLIPTEDLRAVFHREDELLLETKDTLYSQRECVGAGAQAVGTATPSEISQALAELTYKYQNSYVLPRTVTPTASTPVALDKLTRKDLWLVAKNFTSGSGNFTSLLEFNPGSGLWTLTWTGYSNGFFDFPPGTVQVAFIQVSSTLGYLWAIRSNGSGNSIIQRYRHLGTGSGPVVNIDGSAVPVLGDPTDPAFDADYDGGQIHINLSTLKWEFYAFQTQDVTTYPIPDIDLDQLTLYPSFSCAVDAVDALVVGPRVALQLPVSSSSTEDNLYFWRLPVANGDDYGPPGYFSVRERIALFTSSADQIAVRDAVSTAVVAYQIGSEQFSLKVDFAANWFWDSPATGISSVLEIEPVNDSLIQIPTVNATPLLTRTYKTDQRFTKWVSGLSDSYLGVSIGPFGSSDRNSTYFLGSNFLDPNEADTIDSVVFSDCNVSTSFFGVVATTEAGDHVLRWSVDGGAWSTKTLSLPQMLSPDIEKGESVSFTIQDSGPSFRARIVQWFNLDKSVYSYTYEQTTDTITDVRIDYLTSHPNGVATAHLQLGTYPRILWAARDPLSAVNTVVYEIDTDLYVRVQPAQVSLPGGNWGGRGPWTRSLLNAPTTKDWGIEVVKETSALRLQSAQDPNDLCTIQLVELGGGGLWGVVYSDHPDATSLIDTLGTDPHITAIDDTTALLTYVTDAEEVVRQEWSTGQNFSFVGLGLVLTTERRYDQSHGSSESTPFNVWVGKTSPTIVTIYAEDDFNLNSSSLDLAGEGWSALDYVAVYGFDDPGSPVSNFHAAWVGVIAGNLSVQVVHFTYSTLGVFSIIDTVIFNTGLASATWTSAGITVGGFNQTYADYSQVWVEVFQAGGTRDTLTYDIDFSTGESLIKRFPRTTIYGSLRQFDTQLVGVMSPGGIPQLTGIRSGYFLINVSSGEILGRADFGQSEDNFHRLNRRNQVSDLNLLRNTLMVGVPQTRESAEPNKSQVLLWDFSPRPNRPANLARVLISAHGGYPRAYDGDKVYEHDWHELPEITQASPTVGGSLTEGSYGLAITFEFTDSQNQLYRSAPFFIGPVSVVGPNNAIDVVARNIVFTEKERVEAVFWRTLPDGSTYFRDGSVDALNGTPDEFTYSYIAGDSALGDEALDQGPRTTDVVPSTPGEISNFIFTADGRLWGPDPRRESLLRFTIPAAEGYAPHWSDDQGIEATDRKDLTAGGEMAGRIVLWSAVSSYYIPSGGPDRLGNGAYPIPSVIPVEIGALSQSTISLVEPGLAFGSSSGPRLLDKGLRVIDLSEPQDRIYKEDRTQVLTSNYVPSEGGLRWNNDNGTALRFHLNTVRWAEDTQRPALDSSVSKSGTYVVLVVDGRVLVEDDPTLKTDGTIQYVSAVSTRWLRQPTQQMVTHSQYNVGRIEIVGRREGSHTLTVSTYADYDPIPKRVYQFPSSRIDDTSIPYVLPISVTATSVFSYRVLVEDSAEPNPTFIFEQIDVEWNSAGSEAKKTDYPKGWKAILVP